MGRRYDSRVMKPQKVTLEGITFDSEFEASVFRHIRMIYPLEYIKVHERIPVLPESEHFPPLFWKCDFCLSLPWRKQDILIEAKGICTQEFKLVLQALASTSPNLFSNLIVVHNEIGVKIGKTVQTVNIHILYQMLQRLRAN